MPEMKNNLLNIENLLDKKNYAKAYQVCVGEIRKTPHIAQLWVYLGQVLLYTGLGKMAEIVLRKALILDPKARWQEDIPKILAQVPKGKDIPEVIELTKYNSPKITAAIICKNESRCIGRCISSITDAVDEILIIDTGSTDDTIEIAKAFPKTRIINFEWCDDFSAARNFGLSHIKTDWVIWLDADEYLNSEDIPVIKEVAGIFDNVVEPSIIGVVINDILGDKTNDDYGVYRMFNLKDNFKFFGEIHERIVGSGELDDSEIYRTYVRIRFFHDGYNKPQLEDKGKLDRNLKLLEKSVAENPDNPRFLYFYGRELLASGNAQKSIESLMLAERFCTDKDNIEILVPILLLQIKADIKLQNYDAAEAICERILAKYPNFPDAFYYLSSIQVLKAKQYLTLAEVCITETKKVSKDYNGELAFDSNIVNFEIDMLHAEIQYELGNYGAALEAYEDLIKRGCNNEEIFYRIDILRKLSNSN